jgi:hypothetical protein
VSDFGQHLTKGRAVTRRRDPVSARWRAALPLTALVAVTAVQGAELEPTPAETVVAAPWFDPRVDAGYTYDKNVSRGSASQDRLADQSIQIDASNGWIFPFAGHTRALLTLAGGAERFESYPGLSRLFGSGIAELQYRGSGAFGEPIFSLFARFTGEQYESHLRDGGRYAIGVTVRKPITDRITASAAAAHGERTAVSSVFAGRDESLRLNLDYVASATGTIYLTAEFRRGDTFSSGHPSLASLDVAKVFAADDAFLGAGLTAYRFEARSVLATLGYNLQLGPGAFDLAWMRAQSTSVQAPALTGKLHYVTDQFSLYYLLRF